MTLYRVRVEATRVVTETWQIDVVDTEVTPDAALSVLAQGIVTNTIDLIGNDPGSERVTRRVLSVEQVNQDGSVTEGGGDGDA